MLPPDPIEAIKFRMEQRGSSRKDLEEILGVSRGRVSEVLSRQRQLSLSMIRTLNTKFDIPADVLIAEGALLQMTGERRAAKRKTPTRRPSMRLAKK